MKRTPIKVLFVEDNPGDARLVKEDLADSGAAADIQLLWVERLEQGLETIAKNKPEAVLLDLTLPDSSGLETLERMLSAAPSLPVIVMTGSVDEELAMQAMQAGAQDYLIKGQTEGRLLTRSIRYAVERKLAEEALRNSEQRFRALIENGLDYISLLNAEGELLWESPATVAMLGYQPGEFIGENIFVLVHPEDLEWVAEEFRILRRTAGSKKHAIFRLRHTDGTWRWAEVVASNLLDNPSVGAIVLNYRDITERKLAEEALRKSEERFRMVVEATPSAMVLSDQQGKIKLINTRTQEIFGYESDELLGSSIEMLVPEVSRKNHRELRESFTDTAQMRLLGTGRDLVGLRKDGADIPIEIGLTPIQMTEGVFVLASIIDISARKQAEAALRESEEKLRLFIEHAPAALAMFDREMRYIAVSRRWMTNYRLGEQDIHNRSHYEVFPEIPERWKKIHQRGIAGEVIEAEEDRFERLDGSVQWLRWVVRPWRTGEGAIGGIVIFSEDITDRKLAEERLAMSESKMRAVFSAMQDVVLVIDEEGAYQEVAPTDPGLLMYPPEELIGKTLWEVFPLEQAEEFISAIRDVLARRTARRIEYQLEIGGRTIWFSTVVSPLGMDTTVWVAHDITERKQAEWELESRLAELEAINMISTALRSAQTLDEMLPRMLDETLAMLNTEAGMIWLAQKQLEPNVARGWFKQIVEPAIEGGEGIAGHVYTTGNAYHSVEFASDPRTREVARAQVPAGWGGACVPIHTNEGIIGVLFAAVQLPRELQPADVRLLSTIAEIAGNAVQRMRLYEQTQRQVQRLAALHTIDLTINSSMDMRLTLDVFLAQVLTQLRVDAAAVLLLQVDLNILEFVAGRGFYGKGITQTRLRLGEGYAGRAALEQRLISVSDLDERPAVRSKLIAGENFKVYYGIPLVAKGRVRGVLEIFHRAPLNPGAEWLDFLDTLGGQAAIAINNAELYNGLQRSNTELMLAYNATIEGWSHALDLRDRETEGHTQRVAEMTLRLARAANVPEGELVHIRRGALLHDIGKMGVPDAILHKAGPLTDDEWVIMRQHPQLAYDMLRPIGYLRRALDIPYCHHEKWDGSGYPQGLKGEEIPLAARLFAVVDVWDAIRSDRPYRPAWPEEKALQHISSQTGTHFDPKAVEIFFRVLSETNG